MSDFTNGATECFCDRQYKDTNKLASCGDCPRDYIAGAWDARRKYIEHSTHPESQMDTAAKPRIYTLQSAISEVEEIVARAYAPKLDPAVRDTLRASITLWMGELSDPPTSVRVGNVSVQWAGPGIVTQSVSWLAYNAPGVVLWAERAILYRLIADEDQDLADVFLTEEVEAA